MKTDKLVLLLALVIGLAGAAITGVTVFGEKTGIYHSWIGSAGEQQHVAVAKTEPVARVRPTRETIHQPRVSNHAPTFTRTAKEEEAVTPPAPTEASTLTWVEYAANPLETIPHKAYYPSILYDADGFGTGSPLYKMWYDSGAFEYYQSTDGINWTEVGTTSGLSGSPAHTLVKYYSVGFTGANSGSNPSADAMYYRVWYWHGGLYAITDLYYAESADGLIWYNDQSLQQGTPKIIGEATGWNRASYGPAEVFYNASAINTGANPFDYSFVMYYDGSSGGTESIGLGYSVDGITWIGYDADDNGVADPVFAGSGYLGNSSWDCSSPSWDCNYVSRGSVFKTTTGFELWYSGGTGAVNHGIGHAVSRDGLTWTRDPRGTIFAKSDGIAWRDDRTYTPMVLLIDGGLKMWFTGKNSTEYRIGLAEPAAWTFYVDAAWAAEDDGAAVTLPGGGTGYIGFDAFGAVQRAIDTASNGTTIYVAAGTYAENVVVDKSLSLIGALADSDPRSGGWSVPEDITVIDGGGSGGSCIVVSASDVVVNGFKVTGCGASVSDLISDPAGIYVFNDTTSLSNVTVKSCWADENPGNGLTLRDIDSPTVEYCAFTNNGNGETNSMAGLAGQEVTNGIFSHLESSNNYDYGAYFGVGGNTIGRGSAAGDTRDNTFTDCEFHTNAKYGMQLIALSAYDTTRSNIVQSSSFHDNARNALKIVASDDNSFAENEFSNNGYGHTDEGYQYAVFMRSYNYAPCTGNQFMGNLFQSNKTGSVYIIQSSDPQAADTVDGTVFTQNSFGDLTESLAIKNLTICDVDASGNWFGATATAAVTARVSGQLDLTPWLNSETDQDDTTAGFQPDLSYLHVADSTVCPQVGDAGRIQEAVDLAAAEGTVYLTAGEYVDPFLIDGKSVTVQGESKATVLFKPTSALSTTTASYQNAIRIMNSDNTVLDGLTMDFDTIKTNSRIGVRYVASSGTISNCAVKNLSMPDSGGGYSEIAFYLRADSGDDANRKSINVLNNEFIDAGRVGVLTHYWVTSNITGNTFTKTFDDFGYAINVGSQSESTIANNTITGYDTPAASDGSASGGIYIENCFTGGLSSVVKNVSVTGNEISNCQGGIYIGNEFDGYAGDVDIVAVVSNNQIHDNWDRGVVVADEDKEAGSSVNVAFNNNTLLNNKGTGPGGQTGDGLGYDLRTYGDGDITANFTGDTLNGHDYDIYVADGGTSSTSSYAVTIHDSNILGGKTINGVLNTLTDGTIVNATDNWWGDYTGPYHASTNPEALGSTVSDNVDYGLATSAWSKAPEGGLECPGCLIGGVCYNVGQTDPANVCLICQTAGATAWADNDGVTCDDTLWCNGADTCSGGSCSVHAGEQCPENDDVCDGVTSCDEDNNACVTSPVLTCDDGQWCNGAETCDPETGCVAGTSPDCSATDYLSCTIEECDETTDSCVHTYDNSIDPCVVSPGGSIQAAIDLVDAGTTVQVEAGTYDLTAALQIGKALTLLGDATTPGNVVLNAATIAGYARWGVRVQADNVTVQGFRIQGASQLGSSINYNSTAILVGALGTALVSDVQVLDNELTDSSYGVYLNDVHNVTVARNEIWNIHTDQHWAGKGIEIYGQGADPAVQNNNIDILDNEIHDCGLFGIELNHWDTGTGAWVDVDVLIQGNVFHDNGGPLDVLGYPYDLGRGVSANGHEMGVTINDNEFYNHWAGNKASTRLYPDTAGVRINDSKGFVITNNVFHDNMRGIEIHGDDATADYPDANTGFVITGNVFHHNAEGLAVQARGTGSNNIGYAAQNSFYDNNETAYLGTGVTAGPYNITTAGVTDDFDASGNWFGSYDPAEVAATISGAVDFTPWLHSGVDQDDVAAGFQPDLSYLHAADDNVCPQVGTTGRIQEAIEMVDDLGTVMAHAGLYDERLLINKPLTLLGATNGVSKKGYVVPSLYAYDTATETVIKPSTDLNWPVIGIGFTAIGGGSLVLELSAPLTIDGIIVANEIALGGGSRDLIYVGQKVTATSGIEVANSVLGPNTNSVSQPGTNGRSCLVMAGPHKAQVKLLINNNKIFDAKGDGCGIMLVGAYSLTYGEYAYSLNALAGSVIENNEITGNHRSGLELAAGVQGSEAEPFIIRDNLIADNGWRDLSESAQLKYGNGLTCQRSSGDKGNADALGCQYLLIQNNEIRDNEKNGIYLGPMNSELTFTGNLISNNGLGTGGYLKWDAVRLDLPELYYSSLGNGNINGTPLGYQEVSFPENIVLDGNNILDIDATRPTPAEYGINVIQVATNPAGTVLATGNWWGDYTGPYHDPDNLAGLGSAVTDNVDYGQATSAWSQTPEGGLECPGCLIGGVCYNVGQENPANGCLYCETAGATVWADNDGVACDDGNVCNGTDTCGSGACSVHVDPLDCDDTNVCTDDSCDAVLGCQHADNAASCDDGAYCNGADTCSGGSCAVHAGDPCPENSNVCDGITSCNEEGDRCDTSAALVCNDDNQCTDDSCDPAAGCVYTNDDANDCEDGLFCTVDDTCSAGVCLAGPARDCDDGVSCTNDSCNDVSDACEYAPNGDPTCEVEPGGDIQNAIDNIDPGDQILLADAVFTLDEPLIIDKPLNMQGQGAGTTTFDGGAYGASCDPDGIGDTWPRAIHVTSNNVTIDHVKIMNYQGDRVNCWGYGILARGAEAYSGVPGGTTITGLHVAQAEFIDVTLGVRISETDGAVIEDSTYEVVGGVPADAFHLNFSTNALIQNNVITDGDIWVAKGSHNARILNNSVTDAPANCIWAGVNFTGDDLSNSPTIIGNTLQGCYEGGIVLWGKSGEVTANALIENNTITGVQGTYDHHGGISIYAGEYDNLVIRDNVSKDNLSCDCHSPGTAVPGLKLRSTKLTSAVIQGNTFADNLGQGVLVSKVTRVTVDMRYNSIHGNDLGGVAISEGSGTDVDARGSWWGHETGPYHASNPDGQGNAVSDYVLFGEYATAEPGSMTLACRGEVGSYCLTNVSSAQMSVSWSTFGANEKGYVLFGESASNLDQTYYDDRGENTYDENHHVTIKLLAPATTYYFAIVSGGVTYQDGAQPFTAATGPSIGLPVGGNKIIQVQKDGGGTAASGALAYAKLKNDLTEAPDPSLGESVWLSTVIDNDDGLWGVPLGNFRETDLGDYFTYEGLDNIYIFADGAQDGFITWEGNIEDGIPVLVLNDCDGCYIADVCYDQDDKPTPVAPLTDTCEICDIARSRSAWSPDAAGILCRPEEPICDVAEYCDGANTGCPVDAFQAAGVECDPDSGNPCDAPDVCAGDSAACVVIYEPTSTECRAAVNNCDVAENCPGDSELCPADAFEPSSKVCLAKGADPCDADDYCQGDAAVCVEMFAPTTTECRAVGSQGVDADCDVAEFCTGGSNDCPADAFQASGFACNDSEECTSPDACDGAGDCVGPANSGPFITVTDPEPGSVYPGGGGTTDIIWDYGTCPVGDGNGVDNVDIYASLDGGATYPVLVAAATADTGTYAWTLPAVDVDQLRLKVEARAGGVTTGSDAMDSDFEVYMPTGLTIALDTDDKVVLTWDGGPADIYYSNEPYSENPTEWSLIGENVSSGWKDHTSILVPDTYYRLTNADKTAFGAEVAGKTKTALNAGYTLITPPYQEMVGALSAQELLESIGATAKSVMQWDAGAQWWNIHYRQYPNYNNFAIEPGCGYFVEIDGAPTYWIAAGTLIQELFTSSISFDYTLMGFPTGETALAQEVLDEVTAQGGDGHSIYRWDEAGWWDVHYDQYPTNNNFAIEPDNGYFVKNTNYSNQMDDFEFNPLQIEVSPGADGFTVTWATQINASGWLLFYGDDPSSTPAVVLDEVNGLDQDTDHEVVVTGLSAGTYYFDLVVSGVTFDGLGNHHELTLP